MGPIEAADYATSETTKGVYLGLTPQAVKQLTVLPGNTIATIKVIDADDTVIDSQTICKVKGTMVRYSATAYPTNPEDGILLFKTDEIGKYAETGYVLSGLTNKTTYYFSAFSYSDHGMYNLEAKHVLAAPDENEIATVTVSADSGTLPSITLSLTDTTDTSASQTATLTGAGQTSFTVAIGHVYYISASDAEHFLTPSVTESFTAAAGTQRQIAMEYKHGTIYAFHCSGSLSDPAALVTYPTGCDNAGYTPAAVNLSTGAFNYGSWADSEFFMPKPCMLLQTGVVDYYLDPSDYTKKADGVTASDVANTSYAGNAMMEWGLGNGQRIWHKVVPDTGDNTSGTVYISNLQMDASYRAWSFYDANNALADHFYTPIYNGSSISSVMRSISGQMPASSLTAAQESTLAQANNKTSSHIWETEVLADVILINFLLILMSKSTDTQTSYGYGQYSGGTAASSLLKTGTMNAKGLFYGINSTSVGVKVFGMENWWAMQWRRYAGDLNVSGTRKIKLTYGTADGSTVTGYNQTGEGYIALSGATPAGTSGGYVSKMQFNEYGMFGVNASGSSSTYYLDGLWFNNGQTNYACRGGNSGIGLLCGAFACFLDHLASVAYWNIGAAISCKPLAS